jgi:hypothetical protein
MQIILMRIDGPNLDQGTTASLRKLLEKDILCGGVFETSDCRQDYEDLKAKGVEFSSPPVKRFYGVEAVMKDRSGNAGVRDFRSAIRAVGQVSDLQRPGREWVGDERRVQIAAGGWATSKDVPQLHVFAALGLSITNPDWISDSL